LLKLQISNPILVPHNHTPDYVSRVLKASIFNVPNYSQISVTMEKKGMTNIPPSGNNFC
jgi:hypothetical protein